jgi:hypothetical protein
VLGRGRGPLRPEYSIEADFSRLFEIGFAPSFQPTIHPSTCVRSIDGGATNSCGATQLFAGAGSFAFTPPMGLVQPRCSGFRFSQSHCWTDLTESTSALKNLLG